MSSEYEDNNGSVDQYDHLPDDCRDDDLYDVDEKWCITDDSHKYDDVEDDRIIVSSEYDEEDDDRPWCTTDDDDDDDDNGEFYDDDAVI